MAKLMGVEEEDKAGKGMTREVSAAVWILIEEENNEAV